MGKDSLVGPDNLMLNLWCSIAHMSHEMTVQQLRPGNKPRGQVPCFFCASREKLNGCRRPEQRSGLDLGQLCSRKDCTVHAAWPTCVYVNA